MLAGSVWRGEGEDRWVVGGVGSGREKFVDDRGGNARNQGGKTALTE